MTYTKRVLFIWIIFILAVSFSIKVTLCLPEDEEYERLSDDEDLAEWKKHNSGFLDRKMDMDEEEKEHLKEHHLDPNVDFDKMTKGELEFYFFQSHDSNGDNLLDGLELLNALQHSATARMAKHNTQDYYDLSTNDGQQRWNSTFKSLVRSVDVTLNQDDLDKDGYLSYAEFAASRRLHYLKNK